MARSPSKMARGFLPILLLTLFFMLLMASGIALAGSNITNISPDISTYYNQPGGFGFGASGGRVNGLASVPNNNQVFYAASEWGGLYKTADGGNTWFRLEGHMPVATWDIMVNPADQNTIYATSFYDGRVNSLSGIEVSPDAGITWAKPATASPITGPGGNTDPGYICDADRIDEPSAFGIAIDPGAPQNVFVGNNCGLAISNDSGVTWRFVDPTPATPASDIWDVVVQPGGIVDVCGDDGHYRSLDGGSTWPIGGAAPLPRGRCSIDVSPHESYVLFVADDRPVGDPVHHYVWESDDGGQSWTNLGKPYPAGAHKRTPFLVVNERSPYGGSDVFDVWYGEQDLWRISCTTPTNPQPGGSPRCPTTTDTAVTWAGPFSEAQGAHGDSGDLAFDSTVGVDACPMIYSSDGGVFRNTDLGPDCHNPNFTQPTVSPHALWLWGMAGADLPGDVVALNFGVQDDGQWASPDAHSAAPSWTDGPTSDSFSHVADENRVVWLGQDGLHVQSPPGTPGGLIVATPAPVIAFRFTPAIAQFGDKRYAIATTAGVFITQDITASPIVWTALGSGPAGVCGVRAAVDPVSSTPVFYARIGTNGTSSCNQAIYDTIGDQLWKYSGTNSGGTWQQIDNEDLVEPNGSTSTMAGGIGVFGVDPNDPNRLYAANLNPARPGMVFSDDGGDTWHRDTDLDEMMIGGGAFKYVNERGPANDTGFGNAQDFMIDGRRVGYFPGYPQPSLVAFDPQDSNIIVAGGRDSGVFLSTNGGLDWGLVTDPINSASSGIPHIPRPWFAHFQHDAAGAVWIYLGTQGTGVWRIRVQLPTADAGGPYVTDEGTDIVLDAGASNDPDGQLLSYAWDLDNDGEFDDAAGPKPLFDLVGQDGVFTVRVKVSAGGVFAVDSGTVTVNNVVPSFAALSSDAPQPENSAITVNGVISDPGWLDPLTLAINWGDGSPLENINATLENGRPDATLAFSALHTYGDNGTFNVQLCAADDDSTSCQQLVLQVDNVPPTATIDDAGTVLVNGSPTFLSQAGKPLDLAGRAVDPGSDDLTLGWDWDDGPPSLDVVTMYLVNPPNPDPLPSPSIQPRDITDMQSHSFAEACLYRIGFMAADDDGGADTDTATVIITGNGTHTRPTGYWMHQYRGNGKIDFDQATLECYLQITAYMSAVFNEARDASTIPAAYDVLFLKNNKGSSIDKLDRELLTVWLNFANGSLEYSLFAARVAQAETVRLNPTSTAAQIKKQTRILHRINR